MDGTTLAMCGRMWHSSCRMVSSEGRAKQTLSALERLMHWWRGLGSGRRCQGGSECRRAVIVDVQWKGVRGLVVGPRYRRSACDARWVHVAPGRARKCDRRRRRMLRGGLWVEMNAWLQMAIMVMWWGVVRVATEVV